MSDDNDFSTLDDIFQYLTRVHDTAPAVAKAQIWEALRLDKLRVDNRVEVKNPPIDINRRVHYDAWEHTFGLHIQENGCLVVVLAGAVDPPYWFGYSFAVANPKIVHKLWPPKPVSGTERPSIMAVATPTTDVRPPSPALSPEDWLAKAREEHPQRRDETKKAYAARLHPLMEAAAKAGEVTHAWPKGTLYRRLFPRHARKKQAK